MTHDLMFQEEIRRAVARAYSAIPSGGGEAVTRRSYSAEELAELPAGAVAWALGVGDPIPHAGLRPGEAVLDVGSGGGIDTILAARRVGPEGRVIGLDLLDEMCARAREHARAAGVEDWTEFRRGEMEAIPLADSSVDVVVSNGVINLSPRKSRALAEISRVLRPGGRLCLVDLVVDEELPPTVLGSTAAWAGCVSGALAESVFRNKLRKTGFTDISIGERLPFGLSEAALYPLFTPEVIEQMRELLPAQRHENVATSVLVKAVRPLA
ncbi:methyltransferase domain-containing protein [Allosalinactinospora lopnorensis]|uniref:methyltransferase domain-containing protein n=1 Tax=Allosalinactinospora lopnorensis TaxID=1352348 RepID=UPI000623DF3B|nr:methyltransferase domain-containing protein [Allosalinactinospora lopnorensis]